MYNDHDFTALFAAGSAVLVVIVGAVTVWIAHIKNNRAYRRRKP